MCYVKPSELAFYLLLHKNLIITYCISTTKINARGITDSTGGNSDQRLGGNLVESLMRKPIYYFH